jgi:hypothetical protein
MLFVNWFVISYGIIVDFFLFTSCDFRKIEKEFILSLSL